MSDAPKLLVAIPTYNEMENLPRLVDEIFRVLPQVDLLVVDDNSPDGTGQWCDERGSEDPRVHCLHREGKLGLGTAYVAALQYAIEHGYECVLSMDADFSHQPRYLPNLLAGMHPFDGPPVDVMIGSRYIPGGGVQGWPLKRYLMSRGVNWGSRWLLGLKPKDCSGGFRCYRTELLAKLDFSAIRSHGYFFLEEVLWRLMRLGARFSETPIVFVNRQRGASKISWRESFAALRVMLALAWQNALGR